MESALTLDQKTKSALTALGPVKLLVLPGFLGTRHDFDEWIAALVLHLEERGFAGFAQTRVMAVCQDEALAPVGSWSDWNRKVARDIQSWKGDAELFAVGYSLGGRLLLSLQASVPDLFQKLAFLSVNPGLRDPQDPSLSAAELSRAELERVTRKTNDEIWGQRFFEAPWEPLIQEWQAQPVFRDSVREPERLERDYDRAVLARVLTTFSLADQPDFRSQIRRSGTEQLWLAGERDPKYVSFVQELIESKYEHIKGGIVPKASHRIFLDNPRFTSRRVAEFFQPS